ncbi:MAG: uncharacterized protein KVP18_001633 [Porospora cf. gigantea A]|uniref:uncharacterized protein n=1 Tax=Porospora cf. gigantea A TaxID=2853593 RepID=UPI00355A8512|nr:MAG: hypothetical protein KVP18_001633 [Porospora cf. gigantea A]
MARSDSKGKAKPAAEHLKAAKKPQKKVSNDVPTVRKPQKNVPTVKKPQKNVSEDVPTVKKPQKNVPTVKKPQKKVSEDVLTVRKPQKVSEDVPTVKKAQKKVSEDVAIAKPTTDASDDVPTESPSKKRAPEGTFKYDLTKRQRKAIRKNREMREQTDEAEVSEVEEMAVEEIVPVPVNAAYDGQEVAKQELLEDEEVLEHDYFKNSVKWRNKQRVMLLTSRKICSRGRYLMKDFEALLPHARTEIKWDTNSKISELTELAATKNCSSVLYLEKRKSDVYMHMAKLPMGPTVLFHLRSIHLTSELRMGGNCLKFSRPLLSFDPEFDDSDKPELRLMKEMFVQVFGTPLFHPKSKPFHDHVMHFAWFDNNVIFRHYQITPVNDLSPNPAKTTLTELGPRFVMDPIRIFNKSFGGQTVWRNLFYVSPVQVRRLQRQRMADKIRENADHKETRAAVKDANKIGEDPLSFARVFSDDEDEEEEVFEYK